MQIQKTGLYRTYIGVFKETYIGPYTYRRTQENTTSIHPKDTVFISVFIVAHMCTQTYLFFTLFRFSSSFSFFTTHFGRHFGFGADDKIWYGINRIKSIEIKRRIKILHTSSRARKQNFGVVAVVPPVSGRT